MATGFRRTSNVLAQSRGNWAALISQTLDEVYTATKLPFRERSKAKLSGSAEEEAVFETSSRTVAIGWAYEEGPKGLDALGRS